MLSLTSGLDKRVTDGFDSLLWRLSLVVNFHHLEVKVAEETLVLEEGVDIIRLVPNEQILALLVSFLNLPDKVWDAKHGPG